MGKIVVSDLCLKIVLFSAVSNDGQMGVGIRRSDFAECTNEMNVSFDRRQAPDCADDAGIRRKSKRFARFFPRQEKAFKSVNIECIEDGCRVFFAKTTALFD